MHRITAPICMAVLVFALAAGTAQAATTEAGSTTATEAQTARMVSLESGILNGLNRVRAEHGLRTVTVSAGLTESARIHTTSMIATGIFEHESADGTPFDRRLLRSYDIRGSKWWTVGENLIFDSGRLGADEAVRSWMQSPGHRANMLNPAFREVGIVAMRTSFAGGDFGNGPATVVTLDFGARTS